VYEQTSTAGYLKADLFMQSGLDRKGFLFVHISLSKQQLKNSLRSALAAMLFEKSELGTGAFARRSLLDF
jgi:hypothetical protein